MTAAISLSLFSRLAWARYQRGLRSPGWPLKNAAIKIFVILALTIIPSVLAEAQTTPAQPEAIEQQAVPAQDTTPKPELARPTMWGEPTEVRVAIYVIDVDGVDSANQNFSASVFVEARWTSPLLQHEGPGPKVQQTTSIWTPRLTIVNQQQAWNAFPSFVEVFPDGEVVYRQKTWGWFSQPLDLHDFPMDRQVLTIQLVAVGLLQSEVTLTPLIRQQGRSSSIAEKFSMPDFSVVSWNAEPRAYFPVSGEAGTAGFIMEINIQRSPNYYFWKLIVPLCLIVAMSWVPRWLDPKETGTSVGIAATSFLTLVAYLFASSVLLPRVTYFTRMDQFILLSTLMVFVSLLQTVLSCSLVKKSSMRSLERINLWSRAIYPIILLGVLAKSFSW